MAESAFHRERAKITAALEAVPFSTVYLSPFEEPESLPCAVVLAELETGADETQDGFLAAEWTFTVRLVADAVDDTDPDKTLFNLKERFRAAYKALTYSDIEEAEYYTSMFGANNVRVCSITVKIQGEAGAAADHSNRIMESGLEDSRAKITTALAAAGVSQVKLNPYQEAESLPCAMVWTGQEKGRSRTQDGFLESDIDFEVHLVADAVDDTDPDDTLYQLKEAFRLQYKAADWRDLGRCEYYTSMFNANNVRVCKISLPVRADLAGFVTEWPPIAPLAPTALEVLVFDQDSFTARWSGPAEGATGYKLDVAEDAAFTNYVEGYEDLDVDNVTTYEVTGLEAETVYYYRVRAYNGYGTSANSGTITIETASAGGIPEAPVAEEASGISQTYFTANWAASEGATGYKLDVAEDEAFTTFVTGYEDLDVGDVESYEVTGLDDETTYFYRLRAYNLSGESDSSNVIDVTTPVALPDAPGEITISEVTDVSLKASWAAAARADSYTVEIADNAEFTDADSYAGVTDLYKVITGLAQNTAYWARVKGVNESGGSGGGAGKKGGGNGGSGIIIVRYAVND